MGCPVDTGNSREMEMRDRHAARDAAAGKMRSISQWQTGSGQSAKDAEGRLSARGSLRARISDEVEKRR